MSDNANIPAFPTDNTSTPYCGLSKREYISAQIMASRLCSGNFRRDSLPLYAAAAVEAADALLAELAKFR